MTPEPTATAPRNRRHTWRRLLIIAVLIALGYGAWREYEFRAAIHAAKTLGWKWENIDPIEAIQKDWKAAFRMETWSGGECSLIIPRTAEFGRHAGLVRRLAPKFVSMRRRPELKDLSAFHGLSALQVLVLEGCTGLTNVDALKGFKALQALDLNGCTGLTNIDALKGLPSLQALHLNRCTGLTSIDALQGLPSLQALDLSGCTGLTNVEALHGLPSLQKLELIGCEKLPPDAVAALKAALPRADIYDGR